MLSGPTDAPPEPPIRSDIFSIERLEQHAASLAAAQPVVIERGKSIGPRLRDNTRVLTEAYRTIVKAARDSQPITPAAEWLLDNFHVIDEQIREIKDDLPPGYYRLLPKLAEGHLKGYPRVFGIAWAVVAHSDSAFDIEKLTRFVEAYQRVQPLTIGELWAIAITLRITLVENLRRLAQGIVARIEAGNTADGIAERIVSTGKVGNSAAVLRELEAAPWSTEFAVHLAQRLRDRDPAASPALNWLNEKLGAEGGSIDQLLRDEVQRQSATNVTVRNVITSMRLISMVNWPEFFESVSLVDGVLRAESNFAAMDFATRDLYRNAVEEMARGSGKREAEIAKRALDMARKAPRGTRAAEPGYWLIDEGRCDLEKALASHVPLKTRFFRVQSRIGVASYAGAIGLVTALGLALALWAMHAAGASDAMLVALGIVGFVPASDVAVAVVNRCITGQIGAVRLAAMELRDGVPNEMRTIVVVPTLLTNAEEIREQIERLEVHYLSNPDANFSFALLSDWRDSEMEHAPGDDALLEEAKEGIARLNERYGPNGNGARFHLLHRKRVWNPSEEKWIGWERKRGKLHELNRLLRGATDTTFMALDGEPPRLAEGVRYVITLDADTRMPIGTARRLVGKMAHPLNKPVFDPACGLVVEGHAILQPRVTPSLPIGKEGSLFQRIFSGPNGLDPYALAISDVYQDLFEEGSFVGKGIYDVDVFEAALHGQIRENTVLSHDLLEGIFARAGLATDIEVVEEFPSRYDVSAARQHRWTRGDWQLLPYIFGFGKTAHDDVRRTRLPPMGRWKLIDNLRRSLSAPTALLALLLAWALPLRAAAVWTGIVLFTIALPPLLPAIVAVVPPRAHVSLRNHYRALLRDIELGLMQTGFLITFLAHQAWLMVDAVSRTLCRLFIHRRRLLEWVTAAQARRNSSFDSRALATQIAASLAFAFVVGLAVVLENHRTAPIAGPFLALWVLSPLVARWASLPPANDGHMAVAQGDARALRLIARRTWSFFEAFVTADDNHLPPDNFQESPAAVVARRTSPTNIGLYLLSNVAARDFGWHGTTTMLERVEATLATMDKLERFRGHFYNWYETEHLRTLEPKYISSVDSGNLAGHLIALGNACREIAEAPLIAPRWCQGLSDDLALLREVSRNIAEIDAAAALVSDPPETARSTARRLADLTAAADTLVQKAAGEEEKLRARAFRDDVAAHCRDLDLLMPWASLIDGDGVLLLDVIPTIAELPDYCEKALEGLADGPVKDALEKAAAASRQICLRLKTIEETAKAMSMAMEFGFLFDAGRQMLSIGYRGNDGSLDGSFYDLLASEARLASFFAIAKGDVPAKHWFRLGRTLTPIDGSSGLISWSGSMFEYLMPSLVMRAPAGSLLEQTNRLVVWRQEHYGTELGIPWGVSESAFNARNIEQTYQYSSFGIPDLGYKRGLSENVVIAPYATGLAAMIDPEAAVRNFERMARIGARGTYGWYEAIDYTSARLPEGDKCAVVRCYMAHHQAMTILGIVNALQDGAMRARFHAEPMVQAAELLLQERMPRDVALTRPPPEQVNAGAEMALVPEAQRTYNSAHSRMPRTQILSNGRYALMMTAVGSGYSRWRDIAITRWREDPTRDPFGTYIFLRDVKSGETWSAGYQPTALEPDSYDVTFSEDRSEIARRDGTLVTALEVIVSPEDDGEVRRVSITNRGPRMREIELTSYAEIALARQADDVAHPAFAKLFVETEFVANAGAILATRRRRSDGDPQVWAAHLSVLEGESAGDVQFETDRVQFLGRGRTIRSPAAIADGWPLSNTAGPVLDPIFSLRRRVCIPRGATARVSFWTLAAATREDILDLVDRHRDAQAFERAGTLAWTQAQIQLRHLGIAADDAHLFQRLANHVLYLDPVLRPASDQIRRGLRKVSSLWATGISGDLPIVVVRIEDEQDLALVRKLLRAHEYWRLKQLAVDLVILNERAASYVQDLQSTLDSMVRMNQALPKLAAEETRGRVFVLRSDLIAAETRSLLLAAARAVLHAGAGTLAEQVNRARDLKPALPPPPRRIVPLGMPDLPPPKPAMEFFNGLGGFVENGREYMTVLEGGQATPAPWVNVVANEGFGFIVSTDGGGFTWSRNSQQYQITPWSNDAVSDPPGEVIYVRDEETGELWGPTALPIREKTSSYSARHGQGYSRFECTGHGISLELTQFVAKDDPVKISRLKIVNRSGRARRLSVTSYVEWVLGPNRTSCAPYVLTEVHPATGAIFAQNPWNDQFGGRVAFCDLGGKQMAWSCDRTAFIGRDGSLDRPLALSLGQPLPGKSGAALDPCGALQAPVRLSPVGQQEIVFILGETEDKAKAEALVAKYRKADLDAVLAEATQQWDDMLERVQVKTPDRALDILLNRWLPYQALACRVWARTGFYQASGAYGFRDQLQDTMALSLARPDIAREHLLRAAGRQFREGDVQHWWLPESGKGIRTRISDDRVWLGYAVAHYVKVTGDVGILDEPVGWLEGPVLRDNEHDAFFEPTVSDDRAPLFDHCALALDKSLGMGPHGLPLMGTGDWNDGMDRVGAGGRGESVWLGWILYATLNAFAPLAERRDQTEHAAEWRDAAATLKAALEREAWDGDWYRRAFYDDGSPLGSVSNNECRIDSIAQSWAVISRGAETTRAKRAMDAVDKYLTRRDDRLSLLFTPPFDRPSHDPGYIKGYPPGIRENGGQYTHAAAWAAIAFAMQGDGDKAGELLSLLNPIHHADSANGIHRYRVEPYVICADVYSMPPHAGRGGWTWYTGSAGWYYRAVLEWLLGFRVQGDSFILDPCVPHNWPSFEISYRYKSSRYDIVVENPLSVSRGILAAKLDGKMLSNTSLVPLADDGATHQLRVILG
ncbi:MAG: glycosyl transferase [Alphaproteobacteria bacterium]|nr:glycosyl transferase [Alphaproteobacteria bacterium]